ncbi:hypothetical protein RZS08_48185, partial [Arthrospira platensis SPKY1]|nr:hypothetical protein [Arthrospira platensis SPKY1]
CSAALPWRRPRPSGWETVGLETAQSIWCAIACMFIRRTQNRSRISGEPHVTCRLVQSERVGQAVKQSTVLTLGSHFDLPPAHWPALTRRIRRLSGPSPTA